MPLRASKALVAAALVWLAAGTAMGASGPPRLSVQRGPISLDADSTEIDYKTRQVLLKKVIISQGDLRVTADRAEASGTDFDDSHWTFTSNVRITSAQLGVLSSDSAIVQFRNYRLESAHVTGNPAEFEQTSSRTGMPARGHADTIEYEVAMDTVRLTGNAWLEYGGTETSAPVVVYNIRDQRLQFAGAAPGGRVHIIATPPKSGRPGAAPKIPGRARRAARSGGSGPP